MKKYFSSHSHLIALFSILVIISGLLLAGASNAETGEGLQELNARREPATIRPTKLPCVPAPANIVAWWRAEGNPNDQIGCNHGSLLNGASFSPGMVGQGFMFDGNSQYFEVPHSNALNSTAALTIEAWINLSEMPQSPTNGWDVVSKDSPSSGPYLLRVNNDGSVSFWIKRDVVGGGWESVQSSLGQITPNTFFHVAGTFSSQDQRFCVYVNGAGTCAATQGQLLSFSNPLKVGGDLWNSTFFKGVIDEISIYSRALTQSEIQSIYSAGNSGKCATGSRTREHSPSQNPPLDDTALVEAYPGTLGSKIPVILIHGIHGNRFGGIDDANHPYQHYFKKLILYLNGNPDYNSSFKTYKFHYVSDRHTTREIAQALRDRLDSLTEFQDKEIIIVAHSMGGLVARHYMLQTTYEGKYAGQPAGARVKRLLTLATPHRGTFGANGLSRGKRFPFGLRNTANGLLAGLDSVYWRAVNGCGNCEFDPQHSNRVSLLYDNFDQLLNLSSNEAAGDLPNANNYPCTSEFYNNKIVAYWGEIGPDDPFWRAVTRPRNFFTSSLLGFIQGGGKNDLMLATSGYFLDSIDRGRFDVINIPPPGNDGLVPIRSARFDGTPLAGKVHCPKYNHLKMQDGYHIPCIDGGEQKILFRSVLDRILQSSGISRSTAVAPALLTGPSAAGFGYQPTTSSRLAGNDADRTVEIELSNLGDSSLQVTSLSLAGPDAAQFAIVGEPSTPFTVSPLSSVTIRLDFNPTSSGPKTAEMQVVNDSTNPLVTVTLDGAGLANECNFALSPQSQVMPVGGGVGEINIGEISCPWTVSTAEDWINVKAMGPRVVFLVDPNTTQDVREGTIIISVYGRSYLYSISQDAKNASCWLSLSEDRSVQQIEGGVGSFYVTTPATCSWDLQSNSTWLVPSETTLTGSGTVTFSVTENPGPTRSANLTIQNQATSTSYTVHQLGEGASSFDYDGDGKTDFSVFRPSSGAWYLQKSTAGFQGLQFGADGDKLTPADFDGDGKTDIAVYRPSAGQWYVLNSATGTVTYPVFGVAEDVPAPADYDGDGKADLTVFRPSQGTWYRQNSSNGTFFGFQFGANGDVPTVGDFDGDGKNDLGIFRPSLGDWYNIRSSNGSVFGERFGQTGDKIAPADYDGDGKTDIAIFRPSTGLWVVRNSATATYSYYVFGAPSDIPISGDYDGDGKADIGVWRPSDGTWYIQRSSNSQFIVFPWGQNGDRPTPSAYGN